ncbi:MAG: hypothetical protein ACW98X_10070 [Promethearchaeota archaeon]|jgi:hypothetical protein
MKGNQKTYSILTFLLLSIFIISLFQNVNFVHAQSNGESLIVPSGFLLTEFSQDDDILENISSISIPLPSENWDITNVQLNFSDIKLGKEVVGIEDQGQSIHVVDSKGKLGYGVEINITEPTILFGASIYGYITGTPVQPVYLQLQGYDGGTFSPDENILASTLVNISAPGWHLHMFDEEISLTTGSYYLVLNGSELTFPADKSTYNWLYNGSGSVNINLDTAEYDGSSWSHKDSGKPLLHQLIQRVNRSFDPEEVNMTAEFNGYSYPVVDGSLEGTGNLSIAETYSPESEILNIEITNNRSLDLLFNLSYSIQLTHILSTPGLVLIRESVDNLWTITPTLVRHHDNYTVVFNYPTSWFNISVKRNGEDISSNVILNTTNKYILFPNETLSDGASWEIIANSPNEGITLNVPKTNFQPAQELAFSVRPPINPGNLTYILINSLGFKEYNETMEIAQLTSEEIVLSYTLSSNPNEGVYKAYIYWYDNENAGVITQEFQVNVPFVLDPIYIIIIVAGSALIATASFTSYKLIKRSRRIHEEYRQKIYNKYMDVLNLDYFIIIEKRTGLPIYEQIIASKNIGASLITGFLEAIRNFGIELTGANEQSQTIKLEYQQSKIIMSEFKNFRILLIMKENPSQDFLDSIKTMSYDIDATYGDQIANFTGNISNFKNVKDLLDKHLETTLIYPLQIKTQGIKVNSEEKALIRSAENLMKKRNTDYIFVSQLLSTKKGFQVKDAETILKLIEKKIFQPKI